MEGEKVEKESLDSREKVENHLPSLKRTFSPLKMDGWKTSFLLG